MAKRSMKKHMDSIFQEAKEETLHPIILKQARKTGQLNLSNRGLVSVPQSVWRINLDVPEESKTLSWDDKDDNWWDQIDLTKLNLSSNKISEISCDIQNLVALTVLDLHDNFLVTLPKALGDLTHLQKLDLSHNRFQVIPESIFSLKDLLCLNLSYNLIKVIQDDIGNLFLLEDMDFSHNKIESLSPSIGFLTRVSKFNLSYNEMVLIPPEIGSLRALRYLDLTQNKLSQLPDSISQLTHLELLFLRHNDLAVIPVLENCLNLKELYLGNNSIMGLTREHLEHMINIKVLELRDNHISKIPEDIAILESLERLDLTNNDLSSLPFILGTLTNLKQLLLEGNSLKSIRRDIIMRGTVQLLKYLRSRLDESGELPQPQEHIALPGNASEAEVEKCRLRNSRTLDLSNKRLSQVPEELFLMAAETEVTTINMSKNSLSQFPITLCNVTASITELNVGFNKLNCIPNEVSLLTKLTYLDLRNNELSDLPIELCSLKQLLEIILSFNKFTKLPQVIYQMNKLQNILISDNKINSLDINGLLNLKSLACIDLRNNNLESIPPELGNITWLRSLQLEGNPFRNPRPAILAKGTVSLLQYLRDRIPQ